MLASLHSSFFAMPPRDLEAFEVGRAAAAADAHSPSRVGKCDRRVEDLPGTLSRSERSSAIVAACNLGDGLYKLVWVLSKNERAPPRCQCIACGAIFVGGPDRIMAHNIDEMKAITTCAPKDDESKAEASKAKKYCEERYSDKLAKARIKKRKAELHKMMADASAKVPRTQLKIGEAPTKVVWSLKDDANEKWAKCAYEERLNFRLFDSPAFNEAVGASSRVYLAEKDERKYEGPSAHFVSADSTMKPIYDLAKSAVCASQQAEARQYGVAVNADGWSSNPKRRPVIGCMAETPSFVRMAGAKDTSGASKTAIYTCGLIYGFMEQISVDLDLPIEQCDFVCLDGAEASTCEELMAKCPWLTAGLCTPHSLDLALEDYGKLPHVAKILAEAREIVKFVRSHHKSLYLWRELGASEPLLPGETRFATQFLMSESLLKNKSVAIELVNSREWAPWLKGKKYRKFAEELRARINNTAWWDSFENCVFVCDPLIALLRDCDGSKPIMGKVYYRMHAALFAVQENTLLTETERKALVKIIEHRWGYLHNEYHAAGYALDPEYHEVNHSSMTKIMKELRVVFRRHYHDNDMLYHQCIAEFQAYKSKRVSAFTEASVFEMAKTTPSWEWWATWGGELPALQAVAMKVLSKRSAASSCEHLWSKFKNVWTTARANLGVAKAIKLVMISTNLFLLRYAAHFDIDKQLIEWQEEPEESDDDDDDDDVEPDADL
jgi:hypothetical protein